MGRGRRALAGVLALGLVVAGVVAATPADADGDGVTTRDEVLRHGTSPFAPDTDGDGLPDRREADGTTDPAVADTDGDGLPDRRELDGRTPPLTADIDDDGLDDGTELDAGTRPYQADTDRDGLDDGWEHHGETRAGHPLPGADPLRKDLYVQAYATDGASGPGSYERVREAFAEMPVENPDGSTGIDLHVYRGEPLDHRITFDGSQRGFDRLVDRYARVNQRYPEEAYHVVLFVRFEDTNYTGYADIPGDYVAVDGTADRRTKQGVVVHELLHNVVGTIRTSGPCAEDPYHHCRGGWLNRTIDEDDTYLSKPVANQIEEHGFRD